MASRKKSGLSGEAHQIIGAIVEQFGSSQKAVLERFDTFRDELRQEFRPEFARISERLDALEFAVRQNSADIKQNSADIRQNSADIKQSSEDIRSLREELRRLRFDFDSREELARIASLESRVSEIERKLGAG